MKVSVSFVLSSLLGQTFSDLYLGSGGGDKGSELMTLLTPDEPLTSV